MHDGTNRVVCVCLIVTGSFKGMLSAVTVALWSQVLKLCLTPLIMWRGSHSGEQEPVGDKFRP